MATSFNPTEFKAKMRAEWGSAAAGWRPRTPGWAARPNRPSPPVVMLTTERRRVKRKGWTWRLKGDPRSR
jgi:hypothetical protein